MCGSTFPFPLPSTTSDPYTLISSSDTASDPAPPTLKEGPSIPNEAIDAIVGETVIEADLDRDGVIGREEFGEFIKKNVGLIRTVMLSEGMLEKQEALTTTDASIAGNEQLTSPEK
ncbi:hypothetical protein HDU67_000856 [Dinochytrium kinnereticum]|nr:hypothetical protein HDU67_000856 [Dinochytrium kinnereticum]